MDIVMEAGYKKPLSKLSLEDKEDLVSVITTYHLFIKVKAHMDSFKEGLECFSVLKYISQYEYLLRPLFVDESTPLTACKLNLCMYTLLLYIIIHVHV